MQNYTIILKKLDFQLLTKFLRIRFYFYLFLLSICNAYSWRRMLRTYRPAEYFKNSDSFCKKKASLSFSSVNLMVWTHKRIIIILFCASWRDSKLVMIHNLTEHHVYQTLISHTCSTANIDTVDCSDCLRSPSFFHTLSTTINYVAVQQLRLPIFTASIRSETKLIARGILIIGRQNYTNRNVPEV